MLSAIHRAAQRIGPIASTSTSLIATSVLGSVAGFFFWLLAARSSTTETIGVAAALLSAVSLIAAITEMGLGNAIIRFRSTLSDSFRDLVGVSAVIVSVLGSVTALAFAFAAPLVLPDLAVLSSPAAALLFAGTVAAFNLSHLVDRVLLSNEAGLAILARNGVSAIVRVVLVVPAVLAMTALGPVLAFGIASGVGVVAGGLLLSPGTAERLRFNPRTGLSVLRGKITYAIGIHLGSLVWVLPGLIMPLLVLPLLGPATSGRFYLSWMLTNLLLVIPSSVGSALFARGANDPINVEREFRRSLGATLILLTPMVIALGTLGELFLSVFGTAYAEGSQQILWILAVSVFPFAVTSMIAARHRVVGAVREFIVVSTTATLASLALVAVGGAQFGLRGVGLGWLAGQMVGAAVALRAGLPSTDQQGRR